VSNLYSIDFCNEPVPRAFHNGMLNSSDVNALQENQSLSAWTTFGVGGPARYFVNAQSEADVRAALDFATTRKIPVFVLGGGSNLLVADRGFPGLVLRVGLKGRVWEGSQLRAAAGEDWDAVVAECVDRGLGGVECLSGIPGLVGGTPVQNVGAYGQEVSETIVSVRALDRQTGATTTLSPDQCGFSYRTSIFNSTRRDCYLILEVTYALKQNAAPQVKYPDLVRRFEGSAAPPTLLDVRRVVREVRQSKGMLLVNGDPDCRSAGSFFKNPILTETQYAALQSGAAETVPRYPASSGNIKTSAAWLIERAGFRKGFAIGPAAVSSKHTLAIVNRGGSRAEDLLTLAKTIRRGVEDKFGVRLVPEPVFVGFKEEEWS
jgi:UDP-N-acetylmuramate dehydrogenase